MLRQIVQDYAPLVELSMSPLQPEGASAAPKGMVFHILGDNSGPVEVLDIGFGTGQLGDLIKTNPDTRHWSVDGIDGWAPNCLNPALIQKRHYRNIWQGLAQDLPSDRISHYKIICLLDVIEHLNTETAKWLLRTLLTYLGESSYLFISTPLWFYPQHQLQEGDLEAHLIGVPASSMMALLPVMYSVSSNFVGGFVYTKQSLDFVEFFQPTSDPAFSGERGLKIAKSIRMELRPGVVFKTEPT